jgi:hypothetical protein
MDVRYLSLFEKKKGWCCGGGGSPLEKTKAK